MNNLVVNWAVLSLTGARKGGHMGVNLKGKCKQYLASFFCFFSSLIIQSVSGSRVENLIVNVCQYFPVITFYCLFYFLFRRRGETVGLCLIELVQDRGSRLVSFGKQTNQISAEAGLSVKFQTKCLILDMLMLASMIVKFTWNSVYVLNSPTYTERSAVTTQKVQNSCVLRWKNI